MICACQVTTRSNARLKLSKDVSRKNGRTVSRGRLSTILASTALRCVMCSRSMLPSRRAAMRRSRAKSNRENFASCAENATTAIDCPSCVSIGTDKSDRLTAPLREEPSDLHQVGQQTDAGDAAFPPGAANWMCRFPNGYPHEVPNHRRNRRRSEVPCLHPWPCG